MRRHLRLLAMLTLTLYGCGGGGSSTSSRDLTVEFNYGTGRILLWRPAALPLHATGLEGNEPDCSIVSGELPRGMSLATHGCQISGTPLEVRDTVAMIRLTVTGFTGQVDNPITILVAGPPLNYPFLGVNVRGTRISWRPSHLFADPQYQWQPFPSESVTYSLASGEIPSGLHLNPSTGEIHGILTETAARTFSVSATVTGPNGAFTSTSQSYTHTTNIEGLQFFFGPNDSPVSTQSGAPLSLPPLFNFGSSLNGGDYTVGQFRLAPTSPPLPIGLALDATTGILSGTPVGSGTYALQFEVDISSAGQSVAYLSSPLQLTVHP